MGRFKTIYTDVEVDAFEAMDGLTREEVGEYLAGRDMVDADMEAVTDAIRAIRGGRPIDGQTILERHFLPKHKCVADCMAAFRKHLQREMPL